MSFQDAKGFEATVATGFSTGDEVFGGAYSDALNKAHDPAKITARDLKVPVLVRGLTDLDRLIWRGYDAKHRPASAGKTDHGAQPMSDGPDPSAADPRSTGSGPSPDHRP